MDIPTQLYLTDEQKKSITFIKRFYLKGGNHLASHVIWDGDRIDVFYLPEENQVQITIQVGDYFYIEKSHQMNGQVIKPETVFDWETANWFLMKGIQLWDDIRTFEYNYKVVGDRLIYAPGRS